MKLLIRFKVNQRKYPVLVLFQVHFGKQRHHTPDFFVYLPVSPGDGYYPPSVPGSQFIHQLSLLPSALYFLPMGIRCQSHRWHQRNWHREPDHPPRERYPKHQHCDWSRGGKHYSGYLQRLLLLTECSAGCCGQGG